MALVKFGGGIIQMTGSIAGNTYARNRYGNYVRARTKPVNPNTDLQNTIRAALATLSTRWAQTLDADQRTAWNLYASSVAMKNRLGESIYLSGYNHYIRSNMILLQAGLALVDNGPTVWELPAHDPTFAIVADDSAQTISVTFNNALAWAIEDGGYMFVFQGSPQNPQRNFFNGPWRLMDFITGDDDPAPTSPDIMPVVFVVTELQHQWCYARIIRADGRLSEPFRADTFCIA